MTTLELFFSSCLSLFPPVQPSEGAHLILMVDSGLNRAGVEVDDQTLEWEWPVAHPSRQTADWCFSTRECRIPLQNDTNFKNDNMNELHQRTFPVILLSSMQAHSAVDLQRKFSFISYRRRGCVVNRVK